MCHEAKVGRTKYFAKWLEEIRTMEPEAVTQLDVRPLREAFPKEAQHFTKWLESNVDALGKRIGLTLTVVQREQAVGDFNVDLVCTEAGGRRVIVENQLERTDHTHLGQVLTYLVNLDAQIAVWVTAEARPEHQKVVAWLNESTPADVSFYLVKVEAVRIGSSPFAPLFTLIARPDQQAKEIGEQKKEWAEGSRTRSAFWQQLIERSKGKTPLFANVNPGTNSWLDTGVGRSGFVLEYYIEKDCGKVSLYIDHGRGSAEKNRAYLAALKAEQGDIESEFGGALQWVVPPNKQYTCIVERLDIGGLAEPDTWPVLQDAMIDAMIRLDKAVRRRVELVRV